MDVSHVRESLSVQAKVTREKLHFFRDRVSELNEDQREKWQEYEKVNGLGLTFIQTPELCHLVRSGLPRNCRGKIWQLLSGSLYKSRLKPLEYWNIARECQGEVTLATEEIERVGSQPLLVNDLQILVLTSVVGHEGSQSHVP